jgi:hypothetical protein
MKHSKHGWQIAGVLASALAASLSGCMEDELPHKGCRYDGDLYRVGESFPSSDGCNTCRCSESGDVACTLRYCAPPDAGLPGPDAAPPEPSGCEIGNITLPDGEAIICPDGCNDCSCNDGQLIQTLKACTPLPQIEICEGAPPEDASSLEALYLDGDALALAITYGGGCEQHAFTLCTDGSFLESNPVQLRVWVKDDAPPDPCLALITEQHVFDVSPIRAWYEEGYQTTTGTVILRTGDDSVRYTF